MSDMNQVLARMEALLDRVEGLLPAPPAEPDWSALAWHWQHNRGRGYLQAVSHPHRIDLDDLHNVDLLSRFSDQGLRLIEVDKQDLLDLPEITALLRGRPERFIVFSDDLSFEPGDPGYKALKVVLDGSVSAASDNLLVYATSNRRHLMPEYMSENLETTYAGDEIRPGESVEEKVSLSDRFGMWLSFYAFSQDEYLTIAAQWLRHFGITEFDEEARRAALQWSLTRGARSGRAAYQFARDYAGRSALAS